MFRLKESRWNISNFIQNENIDDENKQKQLLETKNNNEIQSPDIYTQRYHQYLAGYTNQIMKKQSKMFKKFIQDYQLIYDHLCSQFSESKALNHFYNVHCYLEVDENNKLNKYLIRFVLMDAEFKGFLNFYQVLRILQHYDIGVTAAEIQLQFLHKISWNLQEITHERLRKLLLSYSVKV